MCLQKWRVAYFGSNYISIPADEIFKSLVSIPTIQQETHTFQRPNTNKLRKQKYATLDEIKRDSIYSNCYPQQLSAMIGQAVLTHITICKMGREGHLRLIGLGMSGFLLTSFKQSRYQRGDSV